MRRNALSVLLVALATVFVLQSAQQVINVGPFMDSGLGEAHFTAFQKVNSNFTELYATGLITNTFDANFALTDGTNVHLAASGVQLTNPIVYTNLTIYGTNDGVGNYERLTLKHQGTASGITLTSEAGGSGTVRRFGFLGAGVDIGPALPVGLLAVHKDTGGVYDSNSIAAFFGDTSVGQGDNMFVIGNTINAVYGQDADNSSIVMNYRGYLGGVTRFRDFYIADGKGNLVFTVDGSAGNTGVNTTGPDRRLDVLDTSGPQLRLTYANESTYTDCQSDVSGNLTVTASGGKVGVGVTPTSAFHVGGAIATPVVTKTANYTSTINDSTVLLNAATITNTLPTAVGISGRIYTIKLIASGTTGAIQTTSSQTIDGAAAPLVLTVQHQSRTLQSDGANWRIIAGFL